MRAADYLADRAVAFACFAAAGALVFGLLWLVEVRLLFILFAEGILLLFFLAALAWDFHRRRRYYGRLLALLEQLDEKTLLMEVAERPTFLDARIVADILRRNSSTRTTGWPNRNASTGNTGIFWTAGCTRSKRPSPRPG